MVLQSGKWNIPYIWGKNFCTIDLWKNLSLVRSKNNFLGDWRKNKQTNIFHYQLFNTRVNKLLRLLLLLSYWKVLCFRDLCKIFAKFSFLFSSFWSKSLWTNSFFHSTAQHNVNFKENESEKSSVWNPNLIYFHWKKTRRFLSLEKLKRQDDLFQMEQNVPTFYCIESLHLSHNNSHDFQNSSIFCSSSSGEFLSASFHPFHL